MLGRLLIVEDHPLLAEAVRAAVCRGFPGVAVREAHSISATRSLLAETPVVDLIILDLWLPDSIGLLGLVELREAHPKIPIVVLSAFAQPAVVKRAILCGAAGFISKTTTCAELHDAVRQVLKGRLVYPDCLQEAHPESSRSDVEAWLRMKSLTQQQLRVLSKLCQGLLNKQIAFEMDVGETTVKAHVSEILRKLEVTSRTQAVVEICETDFAGLLLRGETPVSG